MFLLVQQRSPTSQARWPRKTEKLVLLVFSFSGCVVAFLDISFLGESKFWYPECHSHSRDSKLLAQRVCLGLVDPRMKTPHVAFRTGSKEMTLANEKPGLVRPPLRVVLSSENIEKYVFWSSKTAPHKGAFNLVPVRSRPPPRSGVD